MVEPRKDQISKTQSPVCSVKETTQVVQSYDAEGRRQVNQYVFLNTLGQGAFGKVKLACLADDSTQLFAVKKFSKSQLRKKREYFKKKEGGMAYKDQLQNVLMEIAIMKKLQHPNLIQLYEVIDDVEEDKLYIVMDYAKYGEVLKWNHKTCRFSPYLANVEVLSEAQIKRFLRHCIRGLHYMHINNIIHRDIKPQNILIADKHKAKLGDFGVSQLFEKDGDDKISKTEGTYHFMAPECCDPDVESFSGKAADIWALGVTTYCMIFNELPYWDETEYGIIQKIHSEELKISDKRQISEGLRALLLRMLERDPTKRATIQELRQNAWINEGHKTSLDQEELNFLTEVTQDEINLALTPIHTLVWAKQLGKKWKKTASYRALLGKTGNLSVSASGGSQGDLGSPSMENTSPYKESTFKPPTLSMMKHNSTS